jgi:flagellar biogenesis protein FliO
MRLSRLLAWALVPIGAWGWSAPGFAESVNSHAAPPLPDLGVSVLRIFGALLLVLALFLGGVWLFKHSQRALGRSNGANKLHVMEVKSLGNRQSLCVIDYGGQRMLVGCSPAGVSLVSRLPEGSLTEENDGPSPSFADALQRILHRRS